MLAQVRSRPVRRGDSGFALGIDLLSEPSIIFTRRADLTDGRVTEILT